MSMEPQDIIVIDGAQLTALLFELARGNPHQVAVAIDEGGVKVKINDTRWSPPLGRPLEGVAPPPSPSGAWGANGRPLSQRELDDRLAEERAAAPFDLAAFLKEHGIEAVRDD